MKSYEEQLELIERLIGLTENNSDSVTSLMSIQNELINIVKQQNQEIHELKYIVKLLSDDLTSLTMSFKNYKRINR